MEAELKPIRGTVEPSVILIVDDDPRNLIAARAALGEDHELVLASSGHEALKLLLRRDFTVILLDVMMPGLDGFETARLIRSRERTHDTPIIFVTAHRDDDDKVREGYTLGAVDFLFKPIVPEVLAAKVGVFVALQERNRRLQRLERQAHEQRLMEAQRAWESEALRRENASKDEFLAVLAHELRNPLTPIVMSLRMLRDQLVDEAELQQCVGALDRQVRHLNRLVDDLLDISRITSGKITLRPVPTDLVTVVDQALEATASLTSQHRLTVEPGGPVSLVADADRLTQVLSNLLSNAARYTPAGREIRVCYGSRPAKAWIEVRDQGQGIAPDALSEVFRKYYQEARSGSVGLGLGLAIAQHLVELHGGRLTATSDGVGRGACFRVELPFDFLQATPAPPALPGPGRPRQALRILVVDDNDDVRAMVATFLRDYGHRVDEAGDGERAVAMVAASPPDVVLLDIGMPVLDGYATAEQIHDQLGAGMPPLVALTGFGAVTDRARTAERFAAHLVKPVDPDELLSTLEAVLAEHGPEACPDDDLQPEPR